jgi:hypothetical protein
MLLWQRRGWWCRSASSCCYDEGGVDDAETPWSVVAVETGLMMPECLEPLLRWRRGWWCQSPLSCCCGGDGVDDAGASWAVAVAEMGLIMTCSNVQENESAWHYLMLVSLEFRLACRWLKGWFASWLHSHTEVLTVDRIFVVWNIYLERSEGMKCVAAQVRWL